MKYKGVTLFSAALILLGSVGTATSYIVDNPTSVNAADTTSISKLLGDSKASLSKMLSDDTPDTPTADTTDVDYELRKPDGTLSIANKYMTKVSKVSKNDDGSYNVQLNASVTKLLDTDSNVPLLQVTSLNGDDNVKVISDRDTDPSNVLYSFSFNVPNLMALSEDIPAKFHIVVPMLGLPVDAPANFEFNKTDIANAMIAEGDKDGANEVLKKEITELQKQLSDLSTAKDATDAKNKELDSTVKDLNSQLKKLQDDKDASDADVKSLTQKVSELESDKKALTENQDKLNNQIAELNDKVKSLTDNGTSSDQALADAQSELEKVTAAKKAVDAQLAKLQTVADKLKEKLQEAIANANAEKPLDVNDETDTNYTYKVYKKDPTDGISMSSKYFTKNAKVTKNSDGTYNVEIKLEYPKDYGKNAVTFTKAAGKTVSDDQTIVVEDGDNYSQTFNFTADSLDNYIPVEMKMNIPLFDINMTQDANLKFTKNDGEDESVDPADEETDGNKEDSGEEADSNNENQDGEDNKNDASNVIAKEQQITYKVLKNDLSGESASAHYFTKTAYIDKNSDGTYTVEVQMEYPKNYGDGSVKIDSVNGINLSASDVTTSNDDNNTLLSFKFKVDSLDDLKNNIPVTMTMNIADPAGSSTPLFAGTETAILQFDSSTLKDASSPAPTTPSVLTGSGNSQGGTPTTPTGTTSGTLPQTDAKGLPTYIMYAGFLLLAVTLAGAGKVKLTGKK
ncbi:hypothetical protein [Companilactobacillus insicii]|uniref:hypothetical protein n=1 Tax=Companilactobacillus insicii TaxID=1732567 RepID=UPI000F76D222|nr:hypothetical protein [Companilactobacillus insicii]